MKSKEHRTQGTMQAMNINHKASIKEEIRHLKTCFSILQPLRSQISQTFHELNIPLAPSSSHSHQNNIQKKIKDQYTKLHGTLILQLEHCTESSIQRNAKQIYRHMHNVLHIALGKTPSALSLH